MSTFYNYTFHPDARTLLLMISMAIGSDDGTPRLGMRQVGKNWCWNGNWALRYHLGFLRRVFEVVTLLNTYRVCLGHSNRSCSLLVCESPNEESQEDNKCFFRALLKVRGGRDGGGLPEFLGPFHHCIFGQEIPMFWTLNCSLGC